MSRLCLQGSLAVCALLMASSVMAAAGHVYFVRGDVKIVEGNGGFRYAWKGGEIHQGETIRTDKYSSAQLRMTDGGILAIRPATHLKIESYHFSNDEEEDKSFFGLLKGSFRAITGLMGIRNKKSFLVTTPTSTIGIRGSDADMGFDEDRQLTAVRTYSGSHTLTGRGINGDPSTLVISPGDIGIHLAGSDPILGDFFPFAMPAPNQQGERNRTEMLKQKRQKLTENQKQPGKAREMPPLPVAGSVANEIGTGEEVDVKINIENIQQVPSGVAAVGTDMWINSSDNVTATGGGGFVTDASDNVWVNGSGNVVGLVDADIHSAGLKFLAINGNHTSGGTFSISDGGNVVTAGKWGVWQGDFTVVDNGVIKNTISGFHYVYGKNPTSATAISNLGNVNFSYTQIGGIATNEAGALATNYQVSASGTFGSSPTLGTITIGLGSADFASGSSGWTGTFSGNISDLIGTGLIGSGNCASCTVAAGSSNGKFLGGAAQGLLTSLNLSDGINAVIGSAVLEIN